MIKDIVTSINEAGLTSVIYYTFHILGFVALFLCAIWLGKKFGISSGKVVKIVLFVFPIAYLLMLVQFWAESGFTNFGGQNIVRCFVFVPLIAIPIAKAMNVKWVTVCDLLAVSPCIEHGIAHFGCIFSGCCYGVPMENGLYSLKTGDNRFPSQPLEAATAVLIVAFLLLRLKKKNWKSDGKSYPIMLVLFGTTRFFWEFLRDNDKILWGCSSLSFHAFFMAIVGAVILIVLWRKEKKQTEAPTEAKG